MLGSFFIRSILIFIFFSITTDYLYAQKVDNIDDFMEVRNERLPVYYMMSRKSPIVKYLEKGDKVIIEFDIQNVEGSWCAITEEGNKKISGYVQCNELQRQRMSITEDKEQPYELMKYMPEIIKAAGEGNIDIIKEFLKKEKLVNLKEKEHGWTPLIAASFYGRKNIVKLLLERGAHVDERDKFHWTPLMIASRLGYIDIVRILLDAGADVNATSSTGYTALMAAAKQGHVDIVKLLLSRGADVNARDQFGWRAITLAERNGYSEIVEILKIVEGE